MHQTEGVVLQTLQFQDYDQIVTFFTKDFGLLKAIYKGGLSHQKKKGMMASPLLRVEILFTKGKGELHRIQELSILDYGLSLRDSLENLETGCRLAKLLLETQLPGKHSSELYDLFTHYLKAIPLWEFKDLLEISFRLKRLRHDGVFAWGERCAICREELIFESYQLGDAFCKKHAPIKAVHFRAEEKEWIGCLAFCRKFSELEKYVNSERTPDAFEIFFKKLLAWERALG